MQDRLPGHFQDNRIRVLHLVNQDHINQDRDKILLNRKHKRRALDLRNNLQDKGGNRKELARMQQEQQGSQGYMGLDKELIEKNQAAKNNRLRFRDKPGHTFTAKVNKTQKKPKL